MKKLLTVLLSCLMIFSVIGFKPVSAEDDDGFDDFDPKPMAWPGRPGGNGDGSEEWLQGNYGETNGPWKYLSYGQGRVEDYNSMSNYPNAAAGLLSIGISIPFPVLGGILGGITTIASFAQRKLEGAYYKVWLYYSGRCIKTEITTYKNSDFSGYVKSYTFYTKW